MAAANRLQDLNKRLTFDIASEDISALGSNLYQSWAPETAWKDDPSRNWIDPSTFDTSARATEKSRHSNVAGEERSASPVDSDMISVLKAGVADAGASELLRAVGSCDGAQPLLSSELLSRYARVARCLENPVAQEADCPANSVWVSVQRFDECYREVFDGPAREALASATADVEGGIVGRGVGTSPTLRAIRAEMGKKGNGEGEAPAATAEAPTPRASKSAWSQEKLAMDRRSILAVALISIVNAVAVVYRVFDCAWDTEEMKEFGWPLVFARGAAGGAVVCTTFLIMLMSRMFIEGCWHLLPRSLSFVLQPVFWLLENHVKCHIISGILLFVFAVVHTIAHLFGDLPNYASYSHNADGMMGKKTMAQLATSRPGLTGIGMLLIICLITFNSRAKVRASNFERFWTVHHSFLMYVVLLICHAGSWLRPVWKELSMKGLPLAWPVVPFLLLWIFERVRRNMRWREQGQLGGCEVTEITLSNNGSHVRLEMVPPPHMTRHYNLMLRPGSYVMANIPAISNLQWHPFSVCSTSRTGRVVLLIANAGDWTRELNKKCKRLTEQATATQANHSGKSYWKSYGGPAEAAAPEEEARLDIRLDGCYLAPTAAALYGEHVVLVGGGVGVTPMMSVVDHEIMQLSQMLTSHQRRDRTRTVTFVWVTREFDDVVWIKHLLDNVREHAWRCGLAKFLRIRVFITKKLKLETHAARVFWGALRADSRSRYAPEIVTEMGKVCLGRPNWEAEFEDVALNKQQGARVQVYTCSNQAISDSVQAACGKNTYPNGTNFNFNKELFG